MIDIGTPDGLRFELTWEPARDRSVDGVAGARLRATVCGRQVWPGADAGEAWVTRGLGPMLDGIRRRWPALRYGQGLPLDLNCGLREIRAAAEARWAFLDEDDERIDEESEIVASFLGEHDLAAAVGGLKLPPLLVVREGELCRLGTEAGEFVLPWGPTWQTIEALGDAIDARLAQVPTDAVACSLREGWAARRRIDRATALEAMASSLLPARGAIVRELLDAGDTTIEALEQSPLLAVARMSGAVVDAAAIRRICELAATIRAGDSGALNTWCMAVRDRLPTGWTADLPHEQAASLAAAARSELGLGRQGRVDISGILGRLGVTVERADFTTIAVDAIAVWPQGSRPTILLNTAARHADARRERATLAHELCHMLVDRDAALPVAEVVDGRMLESVEKRARAFAAEFLAPKDQLLPRFTDATTKAEAQKALRRVTDQFDVSAQVVAWQVSNRAREVGSVLMPEVDTVLRRARAGG